MRTLLIAAFLLVVSFAHGEDWTYVNRDEKVNRFHMNAKGKLHYDGKVIENFVLQDTADRIGVSPASPDGKHVVIVSFGDEGSQLSLLKIEKRATTILPMQGTPMVWQSWSPDSSYLVLSTYSDAESGLYVVPLSSAQPGKVPVQLHKSGEKMEFDTTTVTWTGPDRFQIEASVHCASGSPGCDSRAEEKPIRIYKLSVNAATLEVTPEEQPLPQQEM
jgi:hypothetical protein